MENIIKGKKYSLLLKELREAIHDKTLKPGDQLAPEAKISAQYDLSLRAVRKVMLQLVTEGLIVRSRGRGSFVCETKYPGQKSTIGLVLPQINIYVNDLIGEIQHACKKRGYKLLIEQTYSQLDTEAEIINNLINEGVSGILVIPAIDENGNGNHALFRTLCKRSYPLVFLDRYIKDLLIDHVVYDNFGAIYELTNHLIESGYKNIFFIMPSFDKMTCISERLAGYHKALSENHMPFKDSFVKKLTVYENIIEDGINELTGIVSEVRKEGNGPSVIIAANDVIGLGLIRACCNLNLRIPEDISLAAFGSDICHLSNPPLTTTTVSTALMGRESVQILFKKLETSTRLVIGTVIPFVLKDGKSCCTYNKEEEH